MESKDRNQGEVSRERANRLGSDPEMAERIESARRVARTLSSKLKLESRREIFEAAMSVARRDRECIIVWSDLFGFFVVLYTNEYGMADRFLDALERESASGGEDEALAYDAVLLIASCVRFVLLGMEEDELADVLAPLVEG